MGVVSEMFLVLSLAFMWFGKSVGPVTWPPTKLEWAAFATTVIGGVALIVGW